MRLCTAGTQSVRIILRTSGRRVRRASRCLLGFRSVFLPHLQEDRRVLSGGWQVARSGRPAQAELTSQFPFCFTSRTTSELPAKATVAADPVMTTFEIVSEAKEPNPVGAAEPSCCESRIT